MTTTRGHHGGYHAHVLRGGSRLVGELVRRGVRLGPVMLLTVPGRTSGLPRTTPVDVFEQAGRRWLVSTHGTGDANWVRNLRTAGECVLRHGTRTTRVTATELPHGEAVDVIRHVLGPRLERPLAGLVLRRTLGLPRRPQDDQLRAAAPLHPVFELMVCD